jgi:hypothetical protein
MPGVIAQPAGRRIPSAWFRLALVFAAVALVYCYRLDRPLLWGDEAETGNAARHILRSGYPTAYDAANISLYENGSQYNRDFLTQKIPWVQYYVGALSLAIFGNDTAGLRMLFALIGALALFPLAAVLRPRVRDPELIAGLVLLSPQVVLFQRSARYYSILILLYSVLVWHLSADFKRPRARFLTAVAIFVLLFHTHPFAAACSAGSLLLFCGLIRRSLLPSYGIAAGLGFLSWLAWYECLGPPLSSSHVALSLFFSNFALWSWTFVSALRAMPLDLDVVGGLPLLAVVLAGGWAFARHRQALRDFGRDPLVGFVLLNLAVQAVAAAVLLGGETAAQFAILRYLPHLVVFGLLACFLLLHAAVCPRAGYLLACVGLVACNLGALSYWTKPADRPVPISWLAPVYSEIFAPPESPWEILATRLRGEPPAPAPAVIGVLPAWSQDIAIFYLGDRFLIPPVLQPPVDQLLPAIHRVLGEAAFRRLFFSRPDWVVDAGGQLKGAPAGYRLDALIPSHQLRPDEGSRPELTRHTFAQPAVVSYIALYRRQGAADAQGSQP